MISRKLIGLLVVSVALAWWSSRDANDDSPRAPRKDTSGPATPKVLSGADSTSLVEEDPWRRIILLPAVESIVPVSTPVYEPPPLPPVELPPPPPPPSAPALTVTYLGMLREKNARVLYVRYQDMPVALKKGDLLGDEYRLEGLYADHAVFRYLPLDSLQELRWDEER